MGTSCKGKCSSIGKKEFHFPGRKFCSVCDYYKVVPDWYCFCCGAKLRYTRKFASAERKEKWREKTRI